MKKKCLPQHEEKAFQLARCIVVKLGLIFADL